jgi:hypothetical protein
MKRTLMIIFLLAMGQAGFSQKSYTYLGGGLSAGVLNYKRLDQMVDNYNITRTGANGSIALTKQMEKFRFHTGYHAAYGWVNAEEGWMADLRFSTRKATSRAEAAGNKYRELEIRNNMLSIGGGYTFINSGLIDMIGGLTADFGAMTFYSQTDSIPRAKMISEGSLGNSLFVQTHVTFGFIGLAARAYYQFQWFSAPLDKLDAQINPFTPQALDKTFNYSDDIGLEVSAIIMFGKKKMNTNNKVIRRK